MNTKDNYKLKIISGTEYLDRIIRDNQDFKKNINYIVSDRKRFFNDMLRHAPKNNKKTEYKILRVIYEFSKNTNEIYFQYTQNSEKQINQLKKIISTHQAEYVMLSPYLVIDRTVLKKGNKIINIIQNIKTQQKKTKTKLDEIISTYKNKLITYRHNRNYKIKEYLKNITKLYSVKHN